MDRLTFRFETKALDDEAGMFEGYASVFGNVDLGGDVIDAGAFKKTLKEVKGRPILWQHFSDMPIGVEIEAAEDEHGLRVKGQLNLATQQGAEAYALLKQGALRGLSIGFNTVKDAITDNIRHIKELKLWEWSVVTFPMNTLANVTAVKSWQEVSEAIQVITRAELPASDIDAEEVKSAIDTLSALIPNEPPKNGTPNDEPHADDAKSLDPIKHLLADMRSYAQKG